MDADKIQPPENNFHDWPSWNYPTLYYRYCTNGVTIPGQKNLLIGIIYITEYVFFVTLYIPSLIVMRRHKLFQHACYKLMFAIGLIDIYVGFMNAFVAGILSIIGANYCDNNMLLIVIGHITHTAWGLYSMSVVILAFNRCIEMHSFELADRLFGGCKAYLWMILPWIYALLFFSTTIDISPIYNSVWSVYLFNIDYRDGAPAVADWVCFWNCAWVIFVLLILYSLLLYRLKTKSGKYQAKNGRSSRIQKHVMLQSFLICFFMFCVAFTYTLCGFVQLPKNMTKIATISLQMCSGFTSIVYLVINKEIRKGVKSMFLKKAGIDAANKSSLAFNSANVPRTQ